jgi:multidrug efflux system outer membrane protein
VSKASKSSRRRAALPVLGLAAVAAALLSGCAYKMDRIENPVQMPAAWDATLTPNAKDGIPKEWWKNFGSAQLNALIEEAFRSNPNIIATEERLKQAERTLSQAHDGLFPDLSVSAGTNKSRSARSAEGLTGDRSTTVSNSESTSLSLSTSYSVDLWGATAARYRQSVATFIGTKYDSDLAHIQLAQSIARSYFNLLSTRSQLEVSRRNLAVAEGQLRIVDARYRNGAARRFELLQQETTVLQQRTNLIPQENNLRAAETALGLLLGRTPQEFHIDGGPELINQLTVPEIAPWVPGELLARRPDIASAETDMASAKANIVIARASLIPVSLSLSSSYSTSSQDLLALSLTDPRTFSLQGALNLATGIFNYRGRHNSYLTAKSNEYLATINYAQTIRTALKDVDDKLANVNAQMLSERSQEATLEQARRSYAQVDVEYRNDTATNQELVQAQQTLFSAEDALARSRISRLNAVIDLYVALGGGWEGPSAADLAMMQPPK